jgi:trimeric autotransporter adhesin
MIKVLRVGSLIDDSVITQKIADSAVVADKIANDGVTNAKIANDAVTGAKIAGNTITTDKMNAVTTSGRALVSNGTTALWGHPARLSDADGSAPCFTV